MTETPSVQVPDLLPKEIVAHLDRHIIGQREAKRAVAVAIRNRTRRARLPKDMQKEIAPSNLLMIGPTGVGKTEIVRRVSSILGAPYAKVEATKFTEVGYVGRDVESMVRDLAEAAVQLVRKAHRDKVQDQAEDLANERLADLLAPRRSFRKAPNAASQANPFEAIFGQWASEEPEDPAEAQRRQSQREIFREKLRRLELEEEWIEIEVEEKAPSSDLMQQMGMDGMMDQMNEMMEKVIPKKKKKRRVQIKEARRILTEEEADKLIDQEAVHEEALELAANQGILFIDEIDKIAESGNQGSGPGVSREGVQRDILPILEGTAVRTKYGMLETDHILFIAAGAFHVADPDDLIPELQGRLPVRVELDSLSKDDFARILVEPEMSLTRQYQALLAADDCELHFEEAAIDAIADLAFDLNQSEENLGARRLTGVLEALLQDILFEAGAGPMKLRITEDYVYKTLKDIRQDTDLSRYVL